MALEQLRKSPIPGVPEHFENLSQLGYLDRVEDHENLLEDLLKAIPNIVTGLPHDSADSERLEQLLALAGITQVEQHRNEDVISTVSAYFSGDLTLDALTNSLQSRERPFNVLAAPQYDCDPDRLDKCDLDCFIQFQSSEGDLTAATRSTTETLIPEEIYGISGAIELAHSGDGVGAGNHFTLWLDDDSYFDPLDPGNGQLAGETSCGYRVVGELLKQSFIHKARKIWNDTAWPASENGSFQEGGTSLCKILDSVEKCEIDDEDLKKQLRELQYEVNSGFTNTPAAKAIGDILNLLEDGPSHNPQAPMLRYYLKRRCWEFRYDKAVIGSPSVATRIEAFVNESLPSIRGPEFDAFDYAIAELKVDDQDSRNLGATADLAAQLLAKVEEKQFSGVSADKLQRAKIILNGILHPNQTFKAVFDDNTATLNGYLSSSRLHNPQAISSRTSSTSSFSTVSGSRTPSPIGSEGGNVMDRWSSVPQKSADDEQLKEQILRLDRSNSPYKRYVKELIAAWCDGKIHDQFFLAQLDRICKAEQKKGGRKLKGFIEAVIPEIDNRQLVNRISDNLILEWREESPVYRLPENVGDDTIANYADNVLKGFDTSWKDELASAKDAVERFKCKQINLRELALCMRRTSLATSGSLGQGRLHGATKSLAEKLQSPDSIKTVAVQRCRRETDAANLYAAISGFTGEANESLNVETIKQQQRWEDVLTAIGCEDKEGVEFVKPLIKKLSEGKFRSDKSAFSDVEDPKERAELKLAALKLAVFKDSVSKGNFVRVGRLLTKIEQYPKKYAGLASVVKDLEKAYVELLILVHEEASKPIKSKFYHKAKNSCLGLFSKLDSARYEIDLGDRARGLAEYFDLPAANIKKNFKRYGRYLGTVDGDLIASFRKRTTGYVERFEKAIPKREKGIFLGHFLWEDDADVDKKNAVRTLIQKTIEEKITQANGAIEVAPDVEDSASTESKPYEVKKENKLPKDLFQEVKKEVVRNQTEIDSIKYPTQWVNEALESYRKFHVADEAQVLETYIVWQQFYSIANEMKDQLKPEKHCAGLYQLISYLMKSTQHSSHDEIFKEVKSILETSGLDKLDEVVRLVYKLGFENAQVILSPKAKSNDAKHIRENVEANKSFAMSSSYRDIVRPLESFDINRPADKFLWYGQNIFKKDKQGELSLLEQKELKHYQNQARLEMHKLQVQKRKRVENLSDAQAKFRLHSPHIRAFLEATLSKDDKEKYDRATANLDRVLKGKYSKSEQERWSNAALVTFAEKSLAHIVAPTTVTLDSALSSVSFESQIEAAEQARKKSFQGYSRSASSLDNHLYSDIEKIAKSSGKVTSEIIKKLIQPLRQYDSLLAKRYKLTGRANITVKYEIMKQLMKLARQESNQEPDDIRKGLLSIRDSLKDLGKNSQLKKSVLAVLGDPNLFTDLMKAQWLVDLENSFNELVGAVTECQDLAGKQQNLLKLQVLQKQYEKYKPPVGKAHSDECSGDGGLSEKINNLVKALKNAITADEKAKKNAEGAVSSNQHGMFAKRGRGAAEAEMLSRELAAIGF